MVLLPCDCNLNDFLCWVKLKIWFSRFRKYLFALAHWGDIHCISSELECIVPMIFVKCMHIFTVWLFIIPFWLTCLKQDASDMVDGRRWIVVMYVLTPHLESSIPFVFGYNYFIFMLLCGIHWCKGKQKPTSQFVSAWPYLFSLQ